MIKAKATGRKRFFKKRGSKLGGKRIMPFNRSTYLKTASNLYPQLPAIMKLSFKAFSTGPYNVAAGAMTIQSVSTISPVQIGGTFPCGFPAMMLLYSRAYIDRITVKFSLIPTLDNNQQIHQATPIEAVAGLAPLRDLNQIGLDQNAFWLLSSVPGNKTALIGNPSGAEETSFFFSVDSQKINDLSHGNDISIESTRLGAIAVPAGLAQDTAMAVFLGVFNPSVVPRSYIVKREISYHVTFAEPHVQTMTAYA